LRGGVGRAAAVAVKALKKLIKKNALAWNHRFEISFHPHKRSFKGAKRKKSNQKNQPTPK